MSSPFLGKECHKYIDMIVLNTSVRQFSLTNCVYKKRKGSKEKKSSPPESEEDIVDDSLLEDPYFDSLRNDSRVLGFIGSSSKVLEHVGVMVLQPWVKWGPRKRIDTSGQLLLDEAAALVATLPGVKVVAKVICSSTNKSVFLTKK